MPYASLKSMLVLLGLLTAFGVFFWRVYQLLWVNLRRGQPSPPFRKWGERIRGLLVFVGGQLRLFRFLIPGTAHFLIFWGFLLLFPTILQAILEGLLAFSIPNYTLPLLGRFGPLAFLQDLFIVLVAFAALYDLYTRLVTHPERYQGSHNREGVVVLIFICLIMVSLLVMNGVRIDLNEDPLQGWRPFSRAIGGLFAGWEARGQRILGEAAYWVHLSVVLLFLTKLPGGKHFHVVTSLPAVLMRNLEPPGRLPPAPSFEPVTGGLPSIGVSVVEQFRWRQLLDFYTCTECGRCQEVCPAYASGTGLSPKILMMSLRDNLIERGRAYASPPPRANPNGPEAAALDKALLGEVISEQALWACASCYACDQECPLFIEHVSPIVDMRRYLVNEGRMDGLLQDALASLGRYGNSFSQSERMRARWSAPVQPRVKDARREAVEYLWFVGDFASYHPALAEITRKTAQVFQHAGLDFGILYDAERNAGNDVRRVGEEGLFEMLVERNVKALSSCDYRTIITTDPHTFNALRNEYPAELFSTNGDPSHRPVLHYTELLDQLIASGQLRFSRKLDEVVTFHDPCYLGRYNGVYGAPRRVITATGCQLREMPRHGDRAACCGAGGGRIWMEEGQVQERPSEARVREAAAVPGVNTLVVSCPKDVAMFQDAVKTTGHDDQLAVKDLIDLVHAAL